MSRNYRSIAESKTLSGGIDNAVTQLTLNNITNLPSPPYVLVLSPDTVDEEAVLVVVDGSLTAPTIRVQRAIETGAFARPHPNGSVVKHMIVGSDLQLVHDHLDNTTTAHNINLKAPLASPTFTGTVVLPSATSIGTVSATELSYVDGVTSSVQTQLNTKAPIVSPTFTGTVTAAALTATGTVTLPSTTSVGTVSSTEIGYLDGVTSPIQTQFSVLDIFPKGMITPFGGSAASTPTGWLLCDGTTKSRTTYAALFAVIGTTYGVGDGSTTFNVPDLLGRSPIGAGAGTGLTARTLADKIGSESTTLTSSHIPEHNHAYNISHDHGAFNAGGGAHQHATTTQIDKSSALANGTEAVFLVDVKTQVGGLNYLVTNPGEGGHDHSIDVPDYSVGNATSGPYGTASPTAVTAVQPSTVVNFIIKH